MEEGEGAAARVSPVSPSAGGAARCPVSRPAGGTMAGGGSRPAGPPPPLAAGPGDREAGLCGPRRRLRGRQRGRGGAGGRGFVSGVCVPGWQRPYQGEPLAGRTRSQPPAAALAQARPVPPRRRDPPADGASSSRPGQLSVGSTVREDGAGRPGAQKLGVCFSSVARHCLCAEHPRAACVGSVDAPVSVLSLWHPFRFPVCLFQSVSSLVSLLAPHTIIFIQISVVLTPFAGTRRWHLIFFVKSTET